MKFEVFIAQRIIQSKRYKSSVSSPIIKIAILSIALGIIMMLVSLSTGLGLQYKIRDKIVGFNGHINIKHYKNNTPVSLFPIKDADSILQDLENVSNIQHLQKVATKAGIIRTEKSFEGVIYKGVDNNYNWNFFKEYLVEGTFPQITDTYSKEVLISETVANRLLLKVGDKIETFFINQKNGKLPNRRIFTVSGIYNSGFDEFDKNLIIGDLKQVQKLNKWSKDQVGGIEVFLNNFDDISLKTSEIYHNTDTHTDVRNIYYENPNLFEWLRLFDTNIYIIIGVMIVVAGISMITTLLVLILEKTQFIGILKTLGSNNISVRKVFLYLASNIILKGLLWGNILGIGILLVQKYFGIITLDPSTYYVKTAPVYLNPLHVLYLNVGTLFLCIIMMIIPSIIITKISPAKTVQFS